MITRSADPNCKTVSGNTCSECYQGYFFSVAENICKQLNPLCKSSNVANGRCTDCYPGYNLDPNSGNCVVFFQDPNCKTFQGSVCVLCSERFYVREGKCAPVSPLCKGYNP